jgi:hypothetical protein
MAFRSTTKRPDHSRTSGARSRRHCPELELLEDRWLPTGVGYLGGHLLTNVEATAVYFGPDWTQNPAYQQRSGQLNAFLSDITNSPFMDMLNEYGVGRGSFAGADYTTDAWNLHSTLINGTYYTTIDDTDITTMLRNEIAAHLLPGPDNNRLYVVYVAPNVYVTQGGQNSVNNFAGYHSENFDLIKGTLYYAVIVDPTAGGTPKGSLDNFTDFQKQTVTTSHELAEACTDADTVLGWIDRNPFSSTYQDEIGDIPQDTLPTGQVTGYLGDGYAVQKIWSNVANASVLWGSNFNVINGDLYVYGDQDFAAENDTITVDETAAGGLRVTLDGIAVSFDPGAINRVFINGGDGNDTINVDGPTAFTAPGGVFINLGSGTDVVNVSLSPSLPTGVSVTGGSGSDSLNVYDQANSVPTDYYVTSTGLTVFPALGLQSGVSYQGLSSVALYGGSAVNNFYSISSTPSSSLYLDTGSGSGDEVIIGENLDALGGPLTIQGHGNSSLRIDDSENANLFQTQYTLTGSSLTRVGQTFDPFGVPDIFHVASINYSGMANLELDTGSLPNFIGIEGTTAATLVGAGPGTQVVTVCAQSRNLDNIQGALAIVGNGSATLGIDDRNNANLVLTQDTLTGSSLTRFGQTVDPFGNPVFHIASITYSGVANLVVSTGSWPTIIDVEGTTAATTVNAGPGTEVVAVCSQSRNLDSIQGALTINGNGAEPLGIDDRSNVNLVLTQDTLSGSTLTRVGQTIDPSTGLPNLFHVASITYNNVGNLVVSTGNLATVIDIEGTWVPTTVNAGPGTLGITVSSQAKNLDNLVGALTLNSSGSVPLVVNDQNNLNVVQTQDTLTGTTLTRVGETINPANGFLVVHAASITYSGLGSITLNTGNLLTYAHLESTSVASTLNTGAETVLIDVSPQAQNLSAIQGPITINGTGSAPLVINDQNDPAAAAYTITASSVTRPGSAGITYGGVPAITVNGGGHGNTFAVLSTAAGTALTVNAGAGNDTISVGSAANTLDGIQGALTVNGQAGSNALKVNDQGSGTGHTYTLTATTLARTGAAAITYGTVGTLTVNGGSGGNGFVISSAPTTTTVTLNGGGGANTLTGPNATTTWTLTGPNAGSLSTKLLFTAMQNLVGGTGNDTFKFTGAGSISGTVSGGGGTANKLDYSALAGPITVNLQTGAAPLINGGAAGGFSGIQSLAGSKSAADKLIGPSADTAWTISTANGGKAGTVSFTGFENLVGGTGVDVFKFSGAGSLSGTLNGGGAPAGKGDWLDFSGAAYFVNVNLGGTAVNGVNPNSATRVAGGAAGALSNIRNVHGGNSGNTLIGNSQGNILIGGTGADKIIGGSGASLLIGDKGADTVRGGSGGDILIGDATTYDAMTAANEAALMSILAEWQSADSYAVRFHDINTGTGGGLNGSKKLNFGTTVKDDGAIDTVTAAASASALDWFFLGTGDTKVNYETGEHINNT